MDRAARGSSTGQLPGGAGCAELRCTWRVPSFEEDDSADDASFQEVLVALVDLVEGVGLGDEFVELEAAGAVELEEVGEVDAGIDVAVEGPDDLFAQEDQIGGWDLHGVGRDRGEADDDAAASLAGSAVGDADVFGFDVADGDDGFVGADAVSEVEDALDRVVVLGVDGVGCAELLGGFEFPVDDIDGDHLGSAGEGGALDGVHADAAEAEDGDDFTGTDLATLGSGAHTGGNTAGDETRLVERDIGVDLDDRIDGCNRVLTEAADHSELADFLAIFGAKTEGAVELGTDGRLGSAIAEDGDASETPAAFATGRDESQEHVIAGLYLGDAGTDPLDDSGSLVAGDDGIACGMVAGREVPVGVADTGSDHLDEHFTGFGFIQIQFFNTKHLSWTMEHSCLRLHWLLPSPINRPHTGHSLVYCSMRTITEDSIADNPKGVNPPAVTAGIWLLKARHRRGIVTVCSQSVDSAPMGRIYSVSVFGMT